MLKKSKTPYVRGVKENLLLIIQEVLNMEENKYICPECGAEMDVVYDKPALNLTCPNCSCKMATTKWEEIDLDDTKYKMFLIKIENPSIDQIKFISKFTGLNFITSKDLLNNGGLVFEGSAIEVLEKKKNLTQENIIFSIDPLFKY